MIKHMPGPWRIQTHKTPKTSKIQIWQDKTGQEGVGEYKLADDVTFMVDARVMAASPDLLKALQSIVDAFEDGYITDPHIQQAKEAISKAMMG